MPATNMHGHKAHFIGFKSVIVRMCYLYSMIMICATSKLSILGSLSNDDGNVNDDGSEKSHFWFALYFFVLVIRVSFLCLKLCE